VVGASRKPPSIRVAYVVARPHQTATFIVRELDAVSSAPDFEVELFSLFNGGGSVLHPSARPWLERARQPGTIRTARDLCWWISRRPLRLASAAGWVAMAHARRPGAMLKALAIVPRAATHARTMAGLGVDHVHAHFAADPALAAWLCGRLTDIPYSFTAHAHDVLVPQVGLGRRVRDAAFVVAIMDFNRRLLSQLGRDLVPVHVVHCGIDVNRYRFRVRAPEPAGPVKAVCAASLVEFKGHRVLFEAMIRGGPELDRVELDVVGDGPLRKSLEELAHSLGIASRIRFLGALPEHALEELLDRAHLFVQPSVVARNGNTDGIPVALMEAMACGVPVVASRVSGIPELVRPGETGVLAEPGDSASLAGALRGLVTHPAAARRRAEAGRKLVEREFALESTTERLVSLFRATRFPSESPSERFGSVR
jgi:glycosyltransferase involved in cell wall biosynthesis